LGLLGRLAGSHSPLRRWLAFRFCEVLGEIKNAGSPENALLGGKVLFGGIGCLTGLLSLFPVDLISGSVSREWNLAESKHHGH